MPGSVQTADHAHSNGHEQRGRKGHPYRFLGVIDNGDMLLNDAGLMINKTWIAIPDHYPGLQLDVMQIMPNHLHGIMVVREVGTDPCVCPNPGTEDGQTQGAVPTGCLSLPDVNKQFKDSKGALDIEVEAKDALGLACFRY